MKVMKKPKIVDAVQYERGLGLEDGFLYGYFDKDGAFRESAAGAANTMQIPYIDTIDGMEFINSGDYIITQNKIKYIVAQTDFENEYESVTVCIAARPEHQVIEHEQTMETLAQRLDGVEIKLHRLATMAQDAWSSLDVRL